MQKKEITKTIYIANDGMEFDSKYLCKQHELVMLLQDETGLDEYESKEFLHVVLNHFEDFVEMRNIIKEGV